MILMEMRNAFCFYMMQYGPLHQRTQKAILDTVATGKVNILNILRAKRVMNLI